VKPPRSDILCRRVGFCLVYPAAVFLLCTAGCGLFSSSSSAPRFVLQDADARRAGALALYSKGLLLEGGENSESTNVDHEASCEAFRQALRLEPDNRRVLAALVSNLTDRQRYDDALAALESFLAVSPDDTEMRFEAARVADAANRPDLAARHCAVLLAVQPGNRELAQALIRLLFQANQTKEALDLIRVQHERFKDRDSAALPVQWAIHFTREGKQPALALKCLDVAIAQRTNGVERAALITLAAESQLLLGQTNSAMASLYQAHRENPSYTTPMLRLGALWALRPNATNRLEQAAQKDKDPQTTLLILAATRQALDDKAGAIAALRAYYNLRMQAGYFPDEGFYLWLGGLIEERNVFEETERFFIDAAAVHAGSSEIKNYLAYLWAEKGVRLDDANRLMNEALADEPDNGAFLDTKGWILFKSGRVFDALQFLLRAAERDKDEPVILDHVGDVLKAAGRENEAITFWTRSHQLDPLPAVAEKLRACGVTVSDGKAK